MDNIATREDFYQTYTLVGEKERLKFINAIKSRPEPDFVDALKGYESTLPELVLEIQSQIQGIEKKQIEVWAGRIGLGHLYAMTFRLFSADVHSAPRCLEEFLEWNESGDLVGFSWGPDSHKNLSPYLLEASRLFLFCMQYVNEVFSLDVNGKLKELQAEFEQLDEPLEG